MRNIKKYEEFKTNESFLGTALFLGALFCLYKFFKGFLKRGAVQDKEIRFIIQGLLTDLKTISTEEQAKKDIAVNEFNDRFFIRIKNTTQDIRILKKEKILMIGNHKLVLTDYEYDELVKILKTFL